MSSMQGRTFVSRRGRWLTHCRERLPCAAVVPPAMGALSKRNSRFAVGHRPWGRHGRQASAQRGRLRRGPRFNAAMLYIVLYLRGALGWSA